MVATLYTVVAAPYQYTRGGRSPRGSDGYGRGSDAPMIRLPRSASITAAASMAPGRASASAPGIMAGSAAPSAPSPSSSSMIGGWQKGNGDAAHS